MCIRDRHFITHPALWKHLQGGRLRSWGAKSLLESGRRGEPYLCGDGYARIGEGSGSTNVLTGSGVDEAWLTGKLLAEAVHELWRQGLPLTKENLEARYERRRRACWLEKESIIAERARNGFQRGILRGFVGMALAGFTSGTVGFSHSQEKPPRSVEDFYRGRLSAQQIHDIRASCLKSARPLHDALMEAAGWPAIEYDGQLLISHQDALLVGGKVQAPADFPDHVVFRNPELCWVCADRLCIEICSGEAIHAGEDGAPVFDREKCVHCGACIWNCTQEIACLLYTSVPGPVPDVDHGSAPPGLARTCQRRVHAGFSHGSVDLDAGVSAAQHRRGGTEVIPAQSAGRDFPDGGRAVLAAGLATADAGRATPARAGAAESGAGRRARWNAAVPH